MRETDFLLRNQNALVENFKQKHALYYTKNMEVEMLNLSKNPPPAGGIEVPALV